MMTLDNALKALDGRKEFATTRYDGLVSINYLFNLPDTFDGIRENFRGITFDEKTGECVSLPFHKFFNVNQKEHTQFHLLKDMEATIYSKEYGSLIHFFEHNGELRASTRMSANTVQAKEALDFVNKNDKLRKDILSDVRQGITPLFEWCTPHGQIVVEYPKPRLIYLNSRFRSAGDYFYNARFDDRVERHSFKFSEVMQELESKQDFEGYVCHLENGLWVKAKCNWYLQRHRLLERYQK